MDTIICTDRIESTVQVELVKVNYLGMSSTGHIRNFSRFFVQQMSSHHDNRGLCVFLPR